MRKQFRSISIIVGHFLFTLASASSAQVVLSEIMFNPSGSEHENEFVEIYNTNSTEAIDLAGWQIADDAGADEIIAHDASTVLAPQQFGIILDPDYFGNSTIYDILIPPEALILTISGSTFGSGAFSNSQPETVHLINSSGDTVASYQYSAPNPDGYSDEKIHLDGGDDAENWADSKYQHGTPGARNSVTPSQRDLAIFTEDIFIDPERPRYTESITVHAQIRNLGMHAMAEPEAALFEDTDRNGTRDESENLARQTVPSLQPGDSAVVSWEIAPLTAGYHAIGVELISIEDDDATNNLALTVLAVGYLPSELVVNEIMYRPSSGEAEWVEVYNRSEIDIDLHGWLLSDSRPTSAVQVSDTSVVVPAGGFAVIAEDSTLYDVFPHITSQVLFPRKGFPALNNTSDAVVLKDLTGMIIDSVAYQSKWGGELGVSLERRRPGRDSNNSKNWGTCKKLAGATPGAKNSISPKDYDVGFGARGIQFNPETPDEGGTVNIQMWVHNLGEMEIEYFVVFLYEIDEMDSLARSGREVAIPFQSLSPLAADDSINIEFELTVINAGRHFLLARLDCEVDQDSTNNVLFAQLDVAYSPSSLVLNEIMYRPRSGFPEWVELYNLSDGEIDLLGWSLKDAQSSLPILLTEDSQIIPSGCYCVVSAEFDSWPDSITVFKHSGMPTLNNDKDTISLFDPSGKPIDSVSYQQTWGGSLGISLEKMWSERSGSDSTNWGSSIADSGSTPGLFNSISPLAVDVAVADSSVWFEPAQSRPGEPVIVYATVCNVGREIVWDVVVNFTVESAASVGGDIGHPAIINELASEKSCTVSTIWESPPSGVHLVMVQVQLDSDQDTEDNQAFAEVTVGFQPGTLLVNEIMYSPLPHQPEWVELVNPTSEAVDLRGWMIADANTSSIAVFCQAAEILPSGGFAVIAKDSTFFAAFDVGTSAVVIHRQLPALNNDRDEVVLYDPSGAEIDRVAYAGDWGGDLGISLERISFSVNSTEPSNWSSCVSTAGGTPGAMNSIYTESLPGEASLSFSPDPFSPDGDGFEDFTIIQLRLPMTTASINLKIYDVLGRLVRFLCNNEPSGSERSIVWDGMADDGRKCRMGIYVVYLEAFDSSRGILEATKKTVVLAGRL